MPADEPGLWQIEMQRGPERILRRLPRDLLQRIQAAINGLAANPRPHGAVKLAVADDLYRIRVGDWRIVYAVLDDVLVVLVLEISPRGGAYRNL